MEFINNLLFGYYPYVAATVFLLGSLVRFDMSQYTWKTNSSQLLDNSFGFQLANVLFHIGMIFLFLGHLIGLLMPHWMYSWFGLTAGSKQILAMVSGGLMGLLVLIGGGMLLYRRLFHPRVRAQSSAMDLFILILLYAQALLGMFTIPISVQHLDGSTMVRLSEWAQYIVTFRPGAAAYVAGTHWIYQAHIFLGLTMFLVFPFTRLVHIWSVPYAYPLRQYQIVRRRQA